MFYCSLTLTNEHLHLNFSSTNAPSNLQASNGIFTGNFVIRHEKKNSFIKCQDKNLLANLRLLEAIHQGLKTGG
jgi:hypothetical protein